ncbi:MAG: DNA-formamidopyrimidine glycosylase [Bacteroidia bacterium]|nr:DNA-formamidopyrimidine glycosylase [Bacteroidia bacterium]
MPELPEVEGFRKYIAGTSLHQVISEVEVTDAKVLNYPTDEFIAALKGRKFISTDRVGKYMFALTDGGPQVMLHYGMTGSPKYYRDPAEMPRHARIIFHFDNGFHLAYNCPRKFGRVTLTPDLHEYCTANKIGPDAAKITQPDFLKRLGKRKVAIKAALLNQSILAGVGNWIADEVLYQAAIHPEMLVADLTPKELENIFSSMQYVIGTALELDAHMPSFPPDFLTHSRWTDKGRPDAPRLDLEIIEVGGRTTYFDPKRQVKRG